MSGKTDCRDNGVAESFFGNLNIERILGMRHLSRSAARQDIVDCIEMLHNSNRRHSTPGYMSPMGLKNSSLGKKRLNKTSTFIDHDKARRH